jgi:hypothetical protein
VEAERGPTPTLSLVFVAAGHPTTYHFFPLRAGVEWMRIKMNYQRGKGLVVVFKLMNLKI